MDFDLVVDTDLGNGKRWVTIAPKGGNGCCLLLAKAVGEQQINSIGKQAGGRVILFLFTDNIERDHNKRKDSGIEFTSPLRKELYGTVAVFKDAYGNL